MVLPISMQNSRSDTIEYFATYVDHLDGLSNAERSSYDEEKCDAAFDELCDLVVSDTTIMRTLLDVKHDISSATLIVEWVVNKGLKGNEPFIFRVTMVADGEVVEINGVDPLTSGLRYLAKLEIDRIFESM